MAVSTASRLRPVDRLILGYLAIASAVLLVRGIGPQSAWLLCAHGLTVVLLLLLSRSELGTVGRALRELYPLVLLLGLYAALDVVNRGGGVPIHDRLIQHWEAMLFGGQPSREWWMAAPSRFWSTVLHGAYLSYYLILMLPAFAFSLRRDIAALRIYIFAVIASFLSCYLFFIFYPVAGPYYAFPHPTGPFVDNSMARLVYAALGGGSSFGAAFPSSHVAATVAATGAATWGSRRLGALLVMPTVLLTVSVVYCQMHYAIDAVAGLGVGLAVLWVSRGLVRGRE